MAKTLTKQKQKVEVNDQFKKALELLEDSKKNVFITGRAGSGKSTLLDYFRKQTKKKVVVLAPTGVAALNVEGQTIHSFFRFKPDVVLKKIRKLTDKSQKAGLYKKPDMIIIDEISMVRSDLLDCVDKFMRLNGKDKKKAFGGTQMVFIGDLYQLPPVVTSKEKDLFKLDYKSQYFFDAKVFEGFEMEFVELEKIYRQQDDDFIDLLNKIRNKSIKDEDIKMLNQRCEVTQKSRNVFNITLTTTNNMADEANYKELIKLKSKSYVFRGRVSGGFEKKQMPTQETLRLKVGAQVMFLNNDSAGRWVNGTIGKILKIMTKKYTIDTFKTDETLMKVELTEGGVVEVAPYTWNIFHYVYNSEFGALDTKKVGSFTQLPLRLAWAVTIHKSQGKTFDNVIIDIGNGTFTHGQVYVALSRCTSLDGVTLKKPIEKKHIWMDYKVVNFLTQYQYRISEKNCSYEEKIEILNDAIKNNKSLEITYLKASDTKSKRKITPLYIDEMEFKGKVFVGLRALCHMRQEERTFRIDRILKFNNKEDR